MADLQPIPFQLNASGKYGLSADNVVFDTYEKTGSHRELTKHISFPSTRAVLWNRVPIGSTTVISLLGKPGSYRDLQLVVNERSLQLAFKQIQLHGTDFNGFFMGQLDQQDEVVLIRIDRFDPGRDGQIQTENGTQMLRLPTTVIPGDIVIPVCLHNGMAFIDHSTSETHTKEEFMKTMQILESWCSRQDKLNPINFLSVQMKCCFQLNGSDVFAYITCGCVCISSKFNVVLINPIPVIPTALARNLISPNALNEVYHEIKTGFVTMDQTRKLLLLLETDPKAFQLPLVGVWLSGVEHMNCVEVWTSCIRFCHSKHIEERVYAPPCNYLLILYSQTTANPLFYEFSMVDGSDDLSFQLLTCCEGIQLQQRAFDVTVDEYAFDLTSKSTGLLANNFNEAQITLNKRLVNKRPGNYFKKDDNSMNKDDCSPQASPSPLPHPQGLKVTPKPDLSLCESFLIDDINSALDSHSDKNEGSVPVKNDVSKKFPRQTKASIARINMNKQNAGIARKKKLAINFNQNTPNGKKSKKTSNELHREDSGELVIKENLPAVAGSNLEGRNEDEPRIPVQIRLQPSPQLQSSLEPNVEDSIIEGDGKMLDMVSNKEHSYHPENYSDVIDNQSFLIDSFSNPPVANVTLSPTYDMHSDNVHINNVSPSSQRNSPDSVSSKVQIEEHKSGDMVRDSDINETLLRFHGKSLPCAAESRSILPITPPPQNNHTDLYELVVSQQKQLTELQQQLQVFLNHQTENEKLQNSENNVDNVLMKEIDGQNQNILNMQKKQQEQLDELQKQLQVFLQHTMKEEEEKRQNTAAESDEQQSVVKVSVGISTGNSLLWPSENLASTHSDTTPRGVLQASGMDTVSPKQKKNCRCCHCCHRHKQSPNKQQSNDSITNNASLQSPNLSEIDTGDIIGSIFNDTASSTKTLGSLKAVDFPVFNDSQQESPVKIQQTMDWNASPMLGESASMLMKQAREQDKQYQMYQSVNPQQEEPVINTKRFYEQMMVQVQEMITAQNISDDTSNTPTPQKSVNPSQLKERPLQNVNMLPSKPLSLTEEEKLEKVRATTIKQLQEIVNDPELSPTKDISERTRSSSMGVMPCYPQINYVSMTTDETFHENYQHVDDIAAKYLPTEYLATQKKEVRNKMVKFEGVYEWQMPGRAGNFTSVNFSCNMSIASKKYLQKYDLVDAEKSSLHPLSVVNGQRHVQEVNVFKEKRKVECEEDKENILDISKLKNLPKLL